MNFRKFAILVLSVAVVATSSRDRVCAADPLDARYPRLAKLRVQADALPPLVSAQEIELPEPHAELKPFQITEDKTNFGVNRILMPALMLNRIDAFYMGTYEARSPSGEAYSFAVQAWQYRDERSAKANVAEFAQMTAAAISRDFNDAAAAQAASQSMKFLIDGPMVVYLVVDAQAPERSRSDFEKLIRSRLSKNAVDVPVVVTDLSGSNRPAGSKPRLPSENSDEMKRQLATVQRKWENDFNKADSPQKQTMLARKLLGEAKEPGTDLNHRAALLLTAAMQAIEAKDIPTVLEISEVLGQQFDYDTPEGQVKLAAMACEMRTTALSSNDLKSVLALCSTAIDQREFYSAKLLLNAAKLSNDQKTQSAVQLLSRRIDAEQSEADRNNNPGVEMDGPVIVRPDIVSEVEKREMRVMPEKAIATKPESRRNERGDVGDNPFVRANDDSIQLPAKFQDVIVGGAGRYLFFQMGDIKKLAVFDVAKREIVHELPLEEADSRIAAGAEHLYIAVRRENVIQRWSLDGFNKELTAKLPFQTPVEEIATGSHATGVIYAGSADKNGVLLSPKTLKPASLKVLDHTGRRPADPLPGAERSIVRASANGRTFCLLSTRYSPGDFRTLVVMGGVVHSFRRGESVSYMAPDSRGELIFTPKGIFTDQSKEFRLSNGLFAKRFQMPAVGGSYSVSVDREDRAKHENATVNIHVGSAAEPFLSLKNITVRPGDYSDFHAQNRLTLDRRVLYFSDSNLLVTLPKSDDLLVLNEVDLDAELRKTGDDYLHVVSRPPQYVKRGQRFQYQLEVKSSNSGVTYTLESGPSGMRVADDGLLSWRVPRRVGEPYDAVITVSNDSGRETTHALRLTIID